MGGKEVNHSKKKKNGENDIHILLISDIFGF